MKQYKTYIFDCDGTITDSTAEWLLIFRDCLTEIGIDATNILDTEIAKYTHNWGTVIHLGVKQEDIPAFAKAAHRLADTYLSSAEQFPGAYQTLETLRANGKHVAIFSTMARTMFEPVVIRNKLRDVAQVIVAGDEVPNLKPAPDGILKVLQELGVAEEDYGTVMYMGDKDTDIQAAHAAGVDAILFYPPSHQAIYDADALQQHNPTATITSWQELLESQGEPSPELVGAAT